MKLHKRLTLALASFERSKQAAIERYRRAHPVLSGAVPVINYVAPTGHGSAWKGAQ